MTMASCGRLPVAAVPTPPDEQPQQAVGEIVDIVQPVARMRVGHAQHARARVVAHALHRGLGGQAGEQRLVEPPPPAMIVSEHAEGLQHLAMLAGARHVAALHHVVDRAGQILDGLGEPAPLELDILGDQARDDDARLVQHDMAERHAFGDGQSGEPRREIAARLGADLVAHEPARGDRLGEHHGGGLQRLDLLVAILPLGAVLHREHADCVAAAQDRHADEGVIDLLARLRPVGEGRDDAGRRGTASARPARAIRPTRPSPGFRCVLWTALGLRPSVANSSSEPSRRRR